MEPHAGPPADCDGSPLRLSAMLEAIKPMTRGAPTTNQRAHFRRTVGVHDQAHPTGMEHSSTTATALAYEPTPWCAVQGAGAGGAEGLMAEGDPKSAPRLTRETS